jgi:hypothetical protein
VGGNCRAVLGVFQANPLRYGCYFWEKVVLLRVKKWRKSKNFAKKCEKFCALQNFAYLCHADLKKLAPQSPGGGIGRHATLRG